MYSWQGLFIYSYDLKFEIMSSDFYIVVHKLYRYHVAISHYK